MEHADRVLTLSDRLSHVTSKDVELESRIADLNSAVEDVGVVVRHWKGASADKEAEVRLIELCQQVFHTAFELKTYADEHL